jgi:hypothetical protein
VERIKDYRSRYMNADLLMGEAEVLSKVKKSRALWRIAKRVYVYGISECAHVRAVLSRKMSIRDIVHKKRRLFGHDLMSGDMEVVACRDRDLEIIVNSLPMEEHIFVNDAGEEMFVEQLFAVIKYE